MEIWLGLERISIFSHGAEKVEYKVKFVYCAEEGSLGQTSDLLARKGKWPPQISRNIITLAARLGGIFPCNLP